MKTYCERQCHEKLLQQQVPYEYGYCLAIRNRCRKFRNSDQDACDLESVAVQAAGSSMTWSKARLKHSSVSVTSCPVLGALAPNLETSWHCPRTVMTTQYPHRRISRRVPWHLS